MRERDERRDGEGQGVAGGVGEEAAGCAGPYMQLPDHPPNTKRLPNLRQIISTSTGSVLINLDKTTTRCQLTTDPEKPARSLKTLPPSNTVHEAPRRPVRSYPKVAEAPR